MPILYEALSSNELYSMYLGDLLLTRSDLSMNLLLHTIIDFVPGFVQGASLYGYLGDKFPSEMVYAIIYAFLTIMAIVGIIITVSIRKKWKKASE